MLDDALKRVAVIGAAGKMGSGISLLLLQEMACLSTEKNEVYILTLIDPNEQGLPGLRTYLRSQMLRYAEKNINRLRAYYEDNPKLISNEEMIHAFVQNSIDLIRLETDLLQARGSHLLFEAAVESLELKVKIFSQLRDVVDDKALFFTNTSSIPISVISDQSDLVHRLMGYHFYNPPAVQRLLEIIPAEDASSEFISLSEELAKRLGKIVIFSKDVAGFIGNGHFLREINVSLEEVIALQKERSQVEAICLVNQMTQELLIRPMGIFQLFDYVGIDVLQRVMHIMSHYLDLSFHIDLIDQMIDAGCTGGQHPDGTQKDGFFQYSGHAIQKVYSIEEKGYVDLPGNLLGELPQGHMPWKALSKKKDKDEILKSYFQALFQDTTPIARLAQKHLVKSREIARQLVIDGVAKNIEDVNTVIMNGFYHLYGPDSQLLPEEAMR